eukprot:CAMPEP_0173102370 /NCGR_PEP_ID=MMETSP1102-20130122/37520_1 /TAXON_ID=49646 /ORGANISM="Geminigera sp., Strain Caron Lab Isolate" /LENGTH=105 /DNA_ID=CAMNT_0013996513 /DNA_START=573 /DNA_END=890 /DNA_ORIENTATION=-
MLLHVAQGSTIGAHALSDFLNIGKHLLSHTYKLRLVSHTYKLRPAPEKVEVVVQSVFDLRLDHPLPNKRGTAAPCLGPARSITDRCWGNCADDALLPLLVLRCTS